MEDIIEKLKKYNLLGRGGAGFPTGLKWEAVKNAKGEKKFVVCNASEGEPGTFKDGYILENFPDKVISGIKIALETLGAESACVYLRSDYFYKFGHRLKALAGALPLTLFKKAGGYIAGEETSLLEAIEGKRPEPRMKPPYPVESGLFGFPTLINNVETFYRVWEISKEKYEGKRFYSISGAIKNKGVFEFSENAFISQILRETNNLPEFDFFVQAGGGASGEILLKEEIDKPLQGAGSIVVYDLKNTDPYLLMEKWADFFFMGNCDKCVPCREGIYRILEMAKKKKIDKTIMDEILFALEETSFCPLGKGTAKPFRGLLEKIWKK
jgi:NADH:ubiquinone oxidoreductase subunit F (NADH-binding)